MQLFLANGHDRFDLGGELRLRNDSGGSTLNFANAALDIPLVCLEPDVLCSQRFFPSDKTRSGEVVKHEAHLGL